VSNLIAARGVTVLTVDDQPVFLRAARQLIAATAGFVEVGQAASGAAALELAAELRPDLVLLDVRMPGMDGVETARRLLAADPDVVVVLISLGEGADFSSSAVPAGVAAHVRKQELSTRRLSDIWAAHGRRGGR
jgi:two-component system invasion response regulator UvrY